MQMATMDEEKPNIHTDQEAARSSIQYNRGKELEATIQWEQ